MLKQDWGCGCPSWRATIHNQPLGIVYLCVYIDVYLCSLDVENPLVGVNSTLRDFPGAVILQDTGGQAP
jgi:hypothetical protein